jgi:uncharacterized protein (DUF1330 family)
MPKGYIYAELAVTDPALFETYRPLAATTISSGDKDQVAVGKDKGSAVDRTPATHNHPQWRVGSY